jgi:hypothetical protein
MEVEVPLIVEPPKVVELLGVVVQRHPLVHGVYYSYLTQLWNSSMNCNEITKGLELKSCGVCEISNVSPMKVYKKPMHGCIG